MTTDQDISRRAFLRRFGIGVAGAGALTILPGGGRAFADASTATAAPVAAGPGGNGGLPVTTNPGELSHFGRLFPTLPPFGAGQNPNAVIADLVTLTSSGANPATPTAGANAPLVEPGGTDDTLNGAVFTYLGQFALAHDLTLDPTPQPSAPVDPTRIPNYETFRLDLSSIYGGGPLESPQIFNGPKFITQLNVNGVADLPRRADGSAIIVELRNDEQEIISQLHYAFEQFHNAVVDLIVHSRLGQSVGPVGTPQLLFNAAAAIVRQYYQWIILHEWLPQILGPHIVEGLLNGSIRRFYNPGPNQSAPMTPVEWSVAANRLHSMVRNAYAMNLVFDHYPNSRTTLFDGANGAVGGNDLHGGRPLPASNVIDWGNFVNELARGGFNPAQTGTSFLQAYKQIIPQLGASSFLLPIGGQTGAAPSGSNNLAFRDLIRGFFYGLPSGQEVAALLGNPVISPTVLLESLPQPVEPSTVPTLQKGTPLWLYALAEAYITQSAAGPTNGFAAYLQPNKAGTYQPDHLGPTGARIIGDVILRLLEIDPAGILNPSVNFVPRPPLAPAVGQFGIADLLVAAGVATYP